MKFKRFEYFSGLSTATEIVFFVTPAGAVAADCVGAAVVGAAEGAAVLGAVSMNSKLDIATPDSAAIRLISPIAASA